MSIKNKLTLYVSIVLFCCLLAILSLVGIFQTGSALWANIYTITLISGSILIGIFSVLTVTTSIAKHSSIKSSYAKFIDDVQKITN